MKWEKIQMDKIPAKNLVYISGRIHASNVEFTAGILLISIFLVGTLHQNS